MPGSVQSTVTYLGVSDPEDSCSNPCLEGQMPVEEEKGQKFGLLGFTTIESFPKVRDSLLCTDNSPSAFWTRV